MSTITNFLEKLHHRKKAQKALKRAKKIESERLASGKYETVQIDSKTQVLRRCN